MGLGVARGDAVHFLYQVDKLVLTVSHGWCSSVAARDSCGFKPYPEVLEVVHSDGIAEEVKESVLEHAAVTVAKHQSVRHLWYGGGLPGCQGQGVPGYTYERTKRSLFSQSGFLGLNFMNWLKRTWAMGAMPLEGVSIHIQDGEALVPLT